MSRLNQFAANLKQTVRRSAHRLGRPAEKAPFKRSLLVETLEQRVLLAADPLAVARVQGSIDSAGEVDRYTFHLDNSAQVSFDSLTENGNLRWSLSGPSGAVVGQTTFQALSGNNGSYAPMTLAPGDYSLSVDAASGATGAYDLRLLDLARSSPIAVNTTVSGVTDERAKTEAFVLDATAGDQLYLKWNTHPDSYLRIYDPYGQQVTSGYGQYYDGLLPKLAYTGRYTVLLDNSNGVPANTAFSFVLHKVVSPVQDLGTLTADVQGISGTLADPGDTSVVRFSLSSPRTIFIDSQTNSDSLLFSLSGPAGVVSDSFGQALSNRGLANYADHAYYGTGLIELAAGDYTLTLSGYNGTAGDYALRLLNVAAGTSIAQGSVVTGQLSPGNLAQIYRFDATAGDNINFDALSFSGGNPSVKLIDPFGRRITYGWNFYDLNNLSLASTGAYILVVSGENNRTADTSYSFQLINNGNTPVVLPTGTAYSLGDTATASIGAGGGNTVYNFSLTEPTTLYFDPQGTTPNSDAYWSLQGPRGMEVADAYIGWYNGYEAARVLRLAAGDYALSFRSTQAMEVPFRVLNMATVSAPLTLNTPTTGQLNPGNGVAVYTFDATAGQRAFFQTTSTSNGNLRWRLVDPTGRETVGNTGWSDWESTLSYTGTYQLLLEGFNGIGATPIDYQFAFYTPTNKDAVFDPAVSQGVAPTWTTDGANPAVGFDGQHDIVVPANPALNLAQDVTVQARVRIDRFDQTWQSIVYKGANVNDANQRTYTMWVNAAGYVYLTTSDNWGEMTVRTANGSIKAGQWYDLTGVIDRSTGLMKMYIDGVEAASTTIRTTQGNARVQDTPLYIGNAHEGWGSNNNQLTGAVADVRLWDKALSAAEVADSSTNPPSEMDANLKLWLKLDEAGGASVADASTSGLSGTIRSRFEGLTGVVAGSLDVPGQQAIFRLSLPEAKTFYLDTLTSYFTNVGWPLQFYVNGPLVNISDNLGYMSNRLISLPAGDFTFTVDGNGRGAGPFAFRLIDTSSAQAISLNTSVSGDLNPGDTAKIYKFDASTGDALYFQNLGATGFTPAWRLIDPFGREVFGRTGLSDRDTTTLAYTGTYMLIVDGDYSNYDQSSHFTFKLNNVTPLAPQAIDIASGFDAGVQRTTSTSNGVSSGGVQLSDAQYIEFPNTSATDQTGSFTLETSFKIDNWPTGSWIPLITKTTDDALRQVGLFIHRDGRIHLGAYPDNNNGYSQIETPSGTVSAGEWHRLAAVYDRVNSQMRILLDGVQVASGYLNPQAAVHLTQPMRMGYNTEGYDFYGYRVTVDQLAIFNKALSTTEVVANLAVPYVGSESGLVALYKFDEATGAELVDTLGTASGSIKRLAERAPGLITGRIDEPGQTARYTFTLTQPTQLYFDNFTRRYDMRWSITGPGVSVGDTFYSGDSNNGRNLLNLPAGTYTITVDADGAATGDYMFRLLDAAGAQHVNLDQEVSARLDPGAATQIYTFDATAGQRVFFDAVSYTSQQPEWRLLDPTGAQVFGINWFNDIDTLTLSRTGTYTLIVEDYTSSGYRNPSRDYSFALRTVADVNKTLTLGSSQYRDPLWTSGPSAGSNAALFDGSNQVVTGPSAALDLTGSFTLEANVKVDAYANTWTPLIARSTDWSHQTFGLWLGSSGQVNLDSNWGGNGWNFGSAANVVRTGQWVHIAATVNRTTGVAAIFVDGVQVASSGIDTRAAASLPDALLHIGSTDLTNGDRGELYGAVSDVRVWNYARTQAEIEATRGSALLGTEAGLVLNLKLNEGSGTSVADSGPNSIAASLGSLYSNLGSTVVEGEITQRGGRVVYSITPSTDKKVLFDTLTPDSRFTWSLVGPDGTVVDNYGQTLSGRRLRDSDAWSRVFFNLKAGQTYQLIVDADGDATGNYAFRLADFADAQPVSYDTQTTWSPTEARTTQLYSFDGTAGDQIVLDRINYTDTRPVWRLFDPAGREIFSNDFYYDSGTLTLSNTGRYTLALEGQIDSRGAQAQTFQISMVGTTTVPGLPTGTAVSFVDGIAALAGTTVNVNEPLVFNFTLTETKRIYVDTLNSAYPQYYNIWTLTGPNGQVDSRWAYDTDGLNRVGWYDLPAGDYAFSVLANNAAYTGAFSYRLVDFASALPITVGNNVTGTLNPSNTASVYSFSGTQGDRLFFNPTAQSNMGNVYWRVVHADTGAVLAGNYFGSGLDNVVLNRSGDYLLTVEGYYGNTGTASYGFTMLKSEDHTHALTLGSTVTGSLAQPGDTERYTFSLGSATKLWFDSFNNNSNIVWRVLDQDGVSVFGDRYNYDYSWTNTSRFDLAAGDYTLVIDGSGSATGDFSFRLLDLALATPITPGATVNGQLAPANETDLYQFNATAGDAFYFDQISRSGGNTYWRLLDPNGSTVWGGEGFYDHGTTTLTQTGTYTLAIEGYPTDGGTLSYSFNVTPVVQQQPVVLSIGVQPAPNLVVQNLEVVGADGSIHSGGLINVSWLTANSGDRDANAPFQERVVVKNAAGETLANVLVPYDLASLGLIAPGGSVNRTASVQLPPGARGAGQLSVSVITDVTNAVAEQGNAGEADNTSLVLISSTLLTYPDLTVSNVAMSPAANLAAGAQATLSWQVNNAGDKATTQPWTDRVVIRNRSTGEIVLDQTTQVDAAQAALDAGASIDRQFVFNWPAGRTGSGTFDITVTTDVLGDVAEYNAADTGETNNAAAITVTNAPDLTVGGLQVTNTNVVSGDTLNLQWTVANGGNAPTPQGWFDRVQVYNQTTGQYLVNVDVAYDPVVATGAALAAGGSVSRSFSVKLPDGSRSVGNLQVIVSADQNASGASSIPESIEYNNDTSVVIAVTPKPYPDLRVSNFIAPATQRSGDSAHFSWTTTNAGTDSTQVASWTDRIILSRDAVMGNGDDILLVSVPHNGALGVGGSYEASVDVVIPGTLDGAYQVAVVTDALLNINEPDTRADNVSAFQPILLTAYHADLIPTFTTVPATAVGGDTMTVSWHVDNTGDATTNNSYWYDTLWLTPDGTLGAGAIQLGTYVHSGVLAPGEGYDVTQQVTVPNGRTGNQKLVVVTDAYNYVFESRFDGNNTAVSTSDVAIFAAPPVDLRVQSVSALPAALPGQVQTVSWTVDNVGSGVARHPWVDQLFVSRDGTATGAIYLGSVSRGANLGAGESYTASLQVATPDLADGDWRFFVLTDAGSQVYETGAADAESANTGVSAAMAISHPDLRPSDIVVPALTGGQAATLTWSVRNEGTGTATGPWVETVYLSRDGVLDGSDVMLGQVTVNGSLPAGGVSSQSLSITPPLTASGAYKIIIVSDTHNQVREATGEGNNRAQADATVTQAPLPNLEVSDVTGPANGLAGRTAQVSWTTRNTGDLAAVGGWSEQVWLSSDDAIGGDQLLANFYYSSNALAANGLPGNSVVRTETVTLPAYALAGNYKLVVRVDTGAAVTEHNELDNAAIASAPLTIGAALGLSLNRSAVSESAGNNAFTGTVVRSGATDSPLTITLGSTLTDLVLPASVVIPAGQSSISFVVGVSDNTQVDGSRTGTLSATASGYAQSSATISVTDNDVPTLTFSAPLTSMDEGHGPLTVTVSRNSDTTSALQVNLTNTKPYKLTSPADLVIPAGASSATFEVTPVNDTVAEGNRDVLLGGSATGFVSGGLSLEILDNDIPVITLDLASAVVSEGAGVAATHGTLTRSIVTDTNLTVALFADVTRLRTPTYVVIPAGEASADFDISIQDNAQADGDHAVKISADVADAFSFVSLLGTRVEKTLLITDNDGPTLTLTVDKTVIAEAAGAGAATATVTRNTPATSDLLVLLSSTDTSEASVATSVVIPAGQSSVSFAINAVHDGVQDGTQNATIVAAATGFNSGSATVQVTDRELADLQVSSIVVPDAVKTGSVATINWTVTNGGLGNASSLWADVVYLSTDNVLSGDDELIGSFAQTTPLGQGMSYTKYADVQMGNRVGQVFVFVVTDNGDNVTEISSANNTRATTLNVTPSYRATVSTTVEQSAGGAAIPLTGRVFDPDTNAPKPFQLVTIDVVRDGTVRTIDALSDFDGNFTAEFTPLPGEAGHFTISADHPGVIDRVAQDAFDVLGMKAMGGISLNLLPGQTQTGTIEIKNLSPIELTQLRASAGNLPPSLTLTFTDVSTLAGNGSILLAYTAVAAADAPAVYGNAPITITSDQGVSTTATLNLSITPLTPKLVTNPGYVTSGMLRGEQTTVSFELSNTGGAATGPLQVQLPPGFEWLSLASEQQLASLAPGEKTTITLVLTPGADLPLQRYDGTIVVAGANAHATVAFQFRAVSEAAGDVRITVTDEYTYFAEDKPNLANATVQLLDAYTYQVVATAVTDASGVINFSGIAEGPYTLQVSAASHDTYRATVHVTPGGLVDEEVFLHRQAVTYNWTVVPTEVTDSYKIVLESTFETEVPMPVVTVDDPFIMPLVIPGYESQFNITLRNHGLINATQVQIRVPQDPDFIITPLISEIPVLAAKSEITVPVKISIRDDSPLLAQLLADTEGEISASGPIGDGAKVLKCLGIDTVYTYECRNNQWVAVPTSITPVVDAAKCLEKIGETIEKWVKDPKKINLLSGACDVIGTVLSCMKLDTCLKALITTACKAATGAAKGGWLGAGAGVLDNWKDILACLCELAKKIDLGTGTGGPGGGGGWWWGGGYGGYGSPYGTPVGYTIPYSGCSDTASSGTDTNLTPQADNGVCAEVRLRIEQEAVITRTGFLGTLEVNNGRSDVTLQDVQMTLDIRDANGNSANDKFVVRGPTLQNIVLDENGQWTIQPSTNGQVQYTFIPTLDAAPDEPTVYSMGGVLHYIDNGTVVDVPLLPARITVYPEAKLNLDYFWQRDVYSDDPFTEQIEPSQPFALGLQVVNVGKGGAGNLTITSAQPEIIENEKGLLIDFKIISSQVGSNATTPSLTVDLGNIAPGATQTAQWNLVSSLQGKFKDFSASFEHLDDNGDLRTSLIQQVNIHELIRAVQVTSPSDDSIPDYLVNDVPDENNLPDVLYMSTGGQAAVTVATNAVLSGGGLTRTLTASMQSGWSYVKVPDALPGYELTSVVRSDGKVIPLEGMVWRTDRTFKAGEPGATRENLIHLLDLDSTGSYTFTFAIVDHVAPTIDQLTGIVAGVHTEAVDVIDVTFSEPIDEGTLSAADVRLTFNGTEVVVPDLTVEYVSGNTWRLSGLGSATGADGNYRITILGAGLSDLAGNAATNEVSVDWAMGASAPVILDVQPVVPALRNSPVASVDVTFSRDMDASSLDWSDLVLTRDGVALDLNTAISLSQIDARTFRINGLDSLSNQAGVYQLTVRATGAQDSTGIAGVGQFSRSWRTDLTAPVVSSIEQLATNPRNIVVQQLDVTFSEAINPLSFDWRDIMLTRDGGAENLITDEVTVEQVDATTWRIKGFNWKVGQDGEYALTVHGDGIVDLAGNSGTGSATETWVMDIVDPLSPTNLVLTQDTGVSATDGLTKQLALQVAGDLPEAGLQVRLTDVTSNKELGYATVTDTAEGSSFISAFTLSSPGQHTIRVRVADAAGNLSPDTFIDVFVDTTAPGVASVASVSPSPRTTPVGSIEFSFDEAIDPSSLSHLDLSLTRDGAVVTLDDTVVVSHVSGNTYRVSGLEGYTAVAGGYQLAVSASGVTDRAGNAGSGSKSTTWVTQAALPTGIRGMVYQDVDGSGTFNPASYNPEAGIAGRTVFLDANGNGALDTGEVSVVTSADGSYAFDDLDAGSYTISEVLPPDWIATAPAGNAYSVNLVEGHTISGADFGTFLTGVISGVKFNDLNANGSRESGENALADWVVFLDADADGLLDAGEASVTTGADGTFSFSGVGPGTVLVGEVVPSTPGVEWHRTTPPVPYDVKSGFSVVADLGSVQLGSISGTKVNDINGNGLRDVDEPGIEGWTIFLDGNGNGLLDAGETSTLTDANGDYRFTALLPGQYVVAEEQRAGWVQTTPLPSPTGVTVTTANSNIEMEADCACGGTWATATGPAMVDYGQVAIQSALDTVGLTQLRADGTYGVLDGRGVSTVVIDTGIDLGHRFFGSDLDGDGVSDRIVYQYDFANGDADASDVNGHGSHVASLIGSQDALYSGVATGTDIIALKVFEDSGKGYFSYLEKALQWVLDNREAYSIGVVNLSLGDGGNWTDDFSRYGLGDELAALAQTDVVVVAAAGNNYLQFGKMGVAYPASDPAAIAVGATWAADFGGPWTVSTGATNYATGEDQIAAFSQRDTTLMDAFAPGARFNGAYINDGIRTMQGTSQAAAFVSGAAALAQQVARQQLGRGLTTGEFAELLRTTGDLITDGDDEVDNVTNTGLQFPRLNMEKLLAGIAQLKESNTGTGGSGTGNSGQTTTPQQAALGVHNISLGAGEKLVEKDFGNFQLGTISGQVFADSDGNGVLNGAELGQQGVVVYLDDNGNGSVDAGERSMLSDALGQYSFSGVGPGTAVVRIVAPAGQEPSTVDSRSVLVFSGQTQEGVDFGLQQTVVGPVAHDDTAQTDEDTSVSINVLANDVSTAPAVLALGALTAAHGQVVVDGTRLVYTPDANYYGIDTFSYEISDGSGLSSAATVVVTVEPINDAPVLAHVVNQVVAEGQTLTLALQASDDDGDELTYQLLQSPLGATISPTGVLSWVASDVDAPQVFSVEVTDPAGLSATQQFSVQVLLGKLVVTGFANTNWGFAVRFNDVIDPNKLNVYGAAAPDVKVVGATTGEVRGSVVYDDDGKGFSFIRTGAQLAADTYNVLIRGAADGVSNARRGALDGDANGTEGGDFAFSFGVSAPPAVRLRLPDFARGPGQAVNVPNTGTGLPITLSSNGTVTSLSMRLRADVDTFTITELRRGADLPADAILDVVAVAGLTGQFDVTITRATPLPVGASLRLMSVIGEVPTSARLGDAGAVVIESVFINGVSAPLAGDAAVDVVAYPGDVNFDGAYTDADVKQVGRLATKLDKFLPQIDDLDANIVADIDGNGVVNALDTSQVMARTKAASTAAIPAVPVIVQPTFVMASAISATSDSSSTGDKTKDTSLKGVPPVNLAGSFSNYSISPAGSAAPGATPSSTASVTVLPASSLRVVPSVASSGAGA